MNETIGLVPPEPGANRFGPNAAWDNGEFLEQPRPRRDRRLEPRDRAPGDEDHRAVRRAGGGREGRRRQDHAQQRLPVLPGAKLLHDGFVRGLPGFNTAAKPGFSKHQNGIAFDLSVAGGDGNPTYEWLKRHATSFGFVRTVSREPWHWEFDEARAQRALASGTFKTPNVKD